MKDDDKKSIDKPKRQGGVIAVIGIALLGMCGALIYNVHQGVPFEQSWPLFCSTNLMGLLLVQMAGNRN